MQPESFLLAIAQIAVTLAGFSGLVVAVRGGSAAAWHPRDIWSLAWMFGTSLGAFFLALLPLLLASFHLRVDLVRTIAGLIMGALMLFFTAAMSFWSRRLTKTGHPARVRYFPAAATSILFVSGCLSILAGAGLFPQVTIGFFLLGLMTCLIVSTLSLVVFLVMFARTAGRLS